VAVNELQATPHMTSRMVVVSDGNMFESLEYEDYLIWINMFMLNGENTIVSRVDTRKFAVNMLEWLTPQFANTAPKIDYAAVTPDALKPGETASVDLVASDAENDNFTVTIAVENPESWVFGVDSHSTGSSLKSGMSISTAVSIRVNETKSQPAIITITIYDGELERIAGAIDSSCITNKEVQTAVSFSSQVVLKQLDGRNVICMISNDQESCSKLSCTKQIDFPSLVAGSYTIKIKPQTDKIKIEV
jgi:hypothetical protein